MERGTHCNGSVSYDANDLAIMLANPTSDDIYSKLCRGVSNRAICQFDRHSDKLALQRILKHVIESCEEVAELMKTDIPELRKPYFAENHNDVGKPLFVVVSMKGVVLFTDYFSYTVFFYRQNPLVKKPFKIRKKSEEPNDHVPHEPTDISNLKWHSVAGLALMFEEKGLVVADPGCNALRYICPVQQLWQLPKTPLKVNNVVIENYDRASFHPCAVRAENDIVFFVTTDPVSGCIYMLELLNQG